MREPKDIVLKKGDIVYYINNYGERLRLLINGCAAFSLKGFEKRGLVIIEVKRPTQYKTIYKAPKQILDKEEKEYLEAVIRPFKNETKYIDKTGDIGNKSEWLRLYIGHIWYAMPLFEKGTMYKGMELNKEYTLDELGLFKN